MQCPPDCGPWVVTFVAWIIFGLVGSWQLPPWRPPPPPPPPDRLDGPRPNPWIISVLGVIGAVVGGWAFSVMFSTDLQNPAGLLVTFTGALAGSVLAKDLYAFTTRGQARG
jgi:hypothetical protein